MAVRDPSFAFLVTRNDRRPERNSIHVPENWQHTTPLAVPRWQRDLKNAPSDRYP
jgi:hypothetical protein